jgi:hypothetical protein
VLAGHLRELHTKRERPRPGSALSDSRNPNITHEETRCERQDLVHHRYIPRLRPGVLAALERGDCVVATARDASSLDTLVAAHGDAVLPISLDVTDRDAVFAAVARAHGVNSLL